MPNWTRNKLVILVPDDKKASLLTSIEGPNDWWAPRDGHDFFSTRGEKAATAHLQMHLEKHLARPPEVLRAEFRADPANIDCPEWMPISRHDVLARARRIILDEQANAQSVLGVAPFSVAKLLPWLGLDEFNAFFPGLIDEDGWWVRDESSASEYNSGKAGYIKLRTNRIGVKWPPTQIVIDQGRGQPREGVQSIEITFDTPWSPMSNLSLLLGDTLAAHGAKCLLTWEEEDNNSGWFLVDPSKDRDESDIYEHGAFSVEGQDDDGETFWNWDTDAFMNRVLDDINDDDFR